MFRSWVCVAGVVQFPLHRDRGRESVGLSPTRSPTVLPASARSGPDHTELPARRKREALGFYRDALGLEVRQDVENNGFRWVTLGAPGQDIDIVLSQPHGGRSPAEGDALSALVTQGPMPAAIFSSDDLEATFDRLVESGAEVLEEPTDQFWGARDCAFRDPSGNLVRIAQAEHSTFG